MENLQIDIHGKMTHAVEVTMQDKNKKVKKAVLFFDMGDDWFSTHTQNEIIGFFAGAITNAIKKDDSAMLMHTKVFVRDGGDFEKKIGSDFAAKARCEGDVFKDCVIYANGEYETF